MIEDRKVEDDGGFSMVELLMFLGTAVILMAISIPMLSSSMRNMQLAADARSIATTLTLAKLSATAQMTQYQVTFDLPGNEWRLDKRNRISGDFELQQDVNGLSGGVANSGITFKDSSTTAPAGFPTASSTLITFDSRGIPREGMSIVYLTNSDDDYAVSVSLSERHRFGDS
jgi:Tfp pilus assembly protein FimT